MNVGRICSRRLVTVNPQLSLKEPAELMREKCVGFLVVVPADPRASRCPVGALTDRDIVVSAVAQSVDPNAIKVGEVMTARPTVAGEADPIRDAMRTMHTMGVRRLPVVNARGELAGVLSLDDLRQFIAEEVVNLAATVRNGQHIEGALPN